MTTHPYIKLVLDNELDLADAKLWLSNVQDTLPSGLPAETEITMKGERKSTPFYKTNTNGSWCYIVPLSRDPHVDEVKAVTLAWHQAYPEGDFEIDYSSAGAAAIKKEEIKSTGLKELALEAAKLSHNSWLTEMSDKGWRYGSRFDQRNKVNPNLLPWDQLNKQYQLNEMRRFVKLVEILHNMKLKLVRQ
jgi:hypothetical protein